MTHDIEWVKKILDEHLKKMGPRWPTFLGIPLSDFSSEYLIKILTFVRDEEGPFGRLQFVDHRPESEYTITIPAGCKSITIKPLP